MSGSGLSADSVSGLALDDATTSAGTTVPGSGSAAFACLGTRM